MVNLVRESLQEGESLSVHHPDEPGALDPTAWALMEGGGCRATSFDYRRRPGRDAAGACS
jgi:hypothetical protein